MARGFVPAPRASDRQVFCDGVALASSARVDAVTTCSATPEDSRRAVDVAQRQAAAG
jgi:hypothetical protein